MKARKLKEILNTNYTIQETEDKICISSYYVTDLISVNKKTLALNYALDTFHEGRNALKSEELEKIWDKLAEMIKDNSIKDIIEGNDPKDNMKTFWYYDDQLKTIVMSYTDEYGWPNVDYTGKLIYDNNCFKTEKEARKYAIERLLNSLEWINKEINDTIERFNDRITSLNETIKSIQIALDKLTDSVEYGFTNRDKTVLL